MVARNEGILLLKGVRIMKFTVNDRCISCGLCVSICPEVFELEKDGLAYAKKQPDEGVLTAKATEAMEGCPVDAIEKHE